VINTYIDRAMSGTNDNRNDFQKMIQDSNKKNFDYVIVYKLDRFSRNRYDSAMYKAILKKNGVKVLSACEQISDNPEGIILESLLEGMAEYYSAELSQKVKRGQQESLKKKNYLGGKIPFGYVVKDKKFIIDEDSANIVKEIFKRFSDGETAKNILDDLKHRGIKNSYNRFFCLNSLMNLLKNKKYIGIFNYGSSEIEDYLPPIITKDLFNDVNQRILINSRTPAKYKANINYLLSGKLFCGNCNTVMSGESGTSKHKNTYYYYKCFKKKKNSMACDKKTIQKSWIEELIINLTMKHIFANPLYNTIINSIVKIYNEEIVSDITLKTLTTNYTKTQHEIENILNAIKSGIKSTSLQKELIKLETELADLEVNIEKQKNISAQPINKSHIEFWFEQFKDLSINNEKACQKLIEAFIHKVILYNNKVVVIYNHSGENHQEIKMSELEQLCSNTLTLAES